jgi:cytosine/adenosine deaminase-related metal-dependent hydrolase
MREDSRRSGIGHLGSYERIAESRQLAPSRSTEKQLDAAGSGGWRVNARLLGAEGDIGSIDEGKVADLLLLDADPLADIRNTRRIHAVIQGGGLVDRESLLRPSN